MSLWQISAYVKELRGFSSTEKAVLFVLAEYYNRLEKVAWPDQGTLAAAAGISERTLKRILQSLETPRPGHPNGVLRRSRRHPGRGAITNYHFVEFEDKGAKKGDKKGDNSGSTIRKNEQTKELRTLPKPPLQGGKTFSRRLTARETRTLNERLCTLLRSHLDQFGFHKFDDVGRPLPALMFAEALKLACQQLLLPIESARAAAWAAGIPEMKEELKREEGTESESEEEHDAA